jgi:hypothetical protein
VAIDFEVERAAIFSVAGTALRLVLFDGRLDEFPFASLVVGDVGAHVLLDFRGRHSVFNLEYLFLYFFLLLADGISDGSGHP